MTILTSYGYGARNAQRADASFRTLKAQLDDLQAQLSSGKKASTYAGLGSAAAKSLSGRQTLSSIEAYASNVTDAQLRLSLMNAGIGQIDKIARSLSVGVTGNYETTPIGQTSAITSASDGMKQILDILSTEVGGRSLYSGRATEVEPVADYTLIVEGDATRAGLKQFVSERRAADLGANGAGRVTTSTTPTTITVAEDAAGPFGMKITGATATGTGLTAATTAGPPASATLGVAAQPVPGDKITLSLRLPDGATTTLTLTARDAPSDDPDSFMIGADAAATAANLKTAAAAAVTRTATEKLPAASALGAAQAFFAGSPNNPPLRVAGPPYDTATATVPGTAANTVIWYRGDDAAGSPRETAPVRTGEGAATVGIGARANEPGFQKVLAALGAMVAQDFPPGDAAAAQRYRATAEAITNSIGDAVKPIVLDFAIATKGLDSARERLGIAKAQVEDAIGAAEDADPNEVAVKLLATQTRLQASYQTTSTISKLSLVNFI